MRSFFYDYKAHQIETFVRETYDAVKKINPNVQVSAAVFKNPIISGRFIGQHWDRWTDWIDVYMPMTYRSHFGGDFEAYLAHLQESTERQIEWTLHKRPVYAGIASTYLYREEFQPFDEIRDRLADLKTIPTNDTKGRSENLLAIGSAYGRGKIRLAQFAPDIERELSPLVERAVANGGRDASPQLLDEIATKLAAFRANPPQGFAPAEKLKRSIEAARKARPDGIAIFAASSLTREKLWNVLEEEFRR